MANQQISGQTHNRRTFLFIYFKELLFVPLDKLTDTITLNLNRNILLGMCICTKRKIIHLLPRV